MAYVRFPIPEFNQKEFKDMAWSPPAFADEAEVKRLTDGQKAGNAAVYGAYPVKPPDAFFDSLSVKGDHRHALMCVLPNRPIKLLGRSHAWFIQRAVVVNSLDPAGMKTVVDWRTPRPMNTRLGPDKGTTIDGGVLYLVACHKYADYWIGNRTIVDSAWKKGQGFRVLSSSLDDINDFHEIYLEFEWGA